jgi:hypothetical protein
MFFFLLFVARLFILDIPPLNSWNACWIHILYCSDYLHLFLLDPVTTAIWLVSFDLIILNILYRTMAYIS